MIVRNRLTGNHSGDAIPGISKQTADTVDPLLLKMKPTCLRESQAKY